MLVSDSLCMPKYAHACMHGIQILFLQAASYWASMMSTVQHTRQVCHTTKKDCGHKGDPVNQQYRAVSVRYAALLHGGGMDQLLCSVLGHYLAAKTECKDCAEKRKDGMRPAVKSVTEQLQRWPVMLLVSVQSQQVWLDAEPSLSSLRVGCAAVYAQRMGVLRPSLVVCGWKYVGTCYHVRITCMCLECCSNSRVAPPSNDPVVGSTENYALAACFS